MRHAYRKRPEDFKRKILQKISTNRNDLYIAEQYWMDFIKLSELRHKYYNLSNKAGRHWTSENTKRTGSIKEKISAGLKAKYENDPEWSAAKKKHMSEVGKLGLSKETQFGNVPAWNKGLTGVQEAWNKRQTDMPWSGKERPDVSKRMSENNPNVSGKSMLGKSHSEESKKKASASNIGKIRSEETKANIKASKAGVRWWTNGVSVKTSKESPGPEWVIGRTLNTL